MTAPLYSDHQKPNRCEGNQGLWFERFFDQYNDQQQWANPKPDTKANSTWLQTFKKAGDDKQLATHTQAQMQLAASLQGQSHVFKASWHFVTGMGNPHPVENGLAWHPTLGVPYLTGAAVKGVVRSYIENYLDDKPENRQKLLLDWFGSDHKDPAKQVYDNQAGNLIFFDALPIKPVTLGVDIMTPHMGKWYEKGGNITDVTRQFDAVPADWHEPIPVSFLVAKEVTLLFSFALRQYPDANSKRPAIDLADVEDVLNRALEQAGAGGKTATGYGGMQLESDGKGNTGTFQQQDERWERSTFQYQKGSGEITATGNKKRATVRGDDAKTLLEKLPDDKRKLLEKQRLVATAVVKSQGNMNVLFDIV